jgi:hypothetical protein
LTTPPNFTTAPQLDYKTNSLITFSWDNVYGTTAVYNDNNLFEVYWAIDSNYGQLSYQQVDQIRETRFTFNIPSSNQNTNAFAFKIRSYNQCGYGNYSPPLRVELASPPQQMLPVATTV